MIALAAFCAACVQVWRSNSALVWKAAIIGACLLLARFSSKVFNGVAI